MTTTTTQSTSTRWVLTICDGDRIDEHRFDDEADAMRHLHRWVDDHWRHQFGVYLPGDTDADDAIAEYFAETDRDLWWSLAEPMRLEPGDRLPDGEPPPPGMVRIRHWLYDEWIVITEAEATARGHDHNARFDARSLALRNAALPTRRTKGVPAKHHRVYNHLHALMLTGRIYGWTVLGVEQWVLFETATAAVGFWWKNVGGYFPAVADTAIITIGEFRALDPEERYKFPLTITHCNSDVSPGRWADNGPLFPASERRRILAGLLGFLAGQPLALECPPALTVEEIKERLRELDPDGCTWDTGPVKIKRTGKPELVKFLRSITDRLDGDDLAEATRLLEAA